MKSASETDGPEEEETTALRLTALLVAVSEVDEAEPQGISFQSCLASTRGRALLVELRRY